MLGQRLACSASLEIVPHRQLSAGISMPPLQHSLTGELAGREACTDAIQLALGAWCCTH